MATTDEIDQLGSPIGKADNGILTTIALLMVHADAAGLRTLKDPEVVTLFTCAKAIVTGGTPEVGETKIITL